MWIPKGAELIRRQRLFEARRLLEEIGHALTAGGSGGSGSSEEAVSIA